jgi:hypothetical protein
MSFDLGVLALLRFSYSRDTCISSKFQEMLAWALTETENLCNSTELPCWIPQTNFLMNQSQYTPCADGNTLTYTCMAQAVEKYAVTHVRYV